MSPTAASPTALPDPLGDLGPGEFGSDIRVHQDDVEADSHDEDVELDRVDVDATTHVALARQAGLDVHVGSEHVPDAIFDEKHYQVGERARDRRPQMDEPYLTVFHGEDVPEFRELSDRVRNAGFEPSRGRDGNIEYRLGLEHETGDSLEAALKAVSDADRGTLYFEGDGGFRLGVSRDRSTEEQREWWGPVRLSFQTTEIDFDHQAEPVVRYRIESLFDLVCVITEQVCPEYVWSAIRDESERYESVKPTGRPIRDHVSDLSWITVMSPAVVEQFGGRDHVLETPAYRVRELDTGHVALLLQDHPYESSPESYGHWKRHLLRD